MNKYDINKAYLEVMNTIQQIKDTGIEIKISPTNDNKEDKNGEDILSRELWKHVTFCPVTDLQRDLIYQNSIRLNQLGILFDTGQGFGNIDWEIDWSLRIEKDSDCIDANIESKKLIKNFASAHFPLPIVH